MFNLDWLHVALLQWLLHGPTDPALQYHDTKMRFVLRQCVTYVVLEFYPPPYGDFYYIVF
jgi:hypothetical protein